MDAILFDLDDTLIVEEPAAVAAFAATAAAACALHPDLGQTALADAARAHARTLWHASPDHAYWSRIGISSWEALWCRWEGDAEPVARTRAWAAGHGRQAWRLALGEQGVDDVDLAAELARRFGEERRMRHQVFTDTGPAIDRLAGTFRLGLITNGASCLQREKFDASGLAARFDTVVVSGDIGAGKPDPEIFRVAARRLGDPVRVTVVGDSYHKDVAGARGAGLEAVWLNRHAARRPILDDGVPEIASLGELIASQASRVGSAGGGSR